MACKAVQSLAIRNKVSGVKILACVPASRMYSQSLNSILGQITTHSVRFWIDPTRVHPDTSSECLRKYSEGRDVALNGGYDGMFCAEDDIIMPSNAIQRLVDVAGTDSVAMGWNALRQSPHTTCAMKSTHRAIPVPISEVKGVIEVAGNGFFCTYIPSSILLAVPFRRHELGHAPDVPFAQDCERAGIKQYCVSDVLCWHMLDDHTAIAPSNTGLLKMGV